MTDDDAKYLEDRGWQRVDPEWAKRMKADPDSWVDLLHPDNDPDGADSRKTALRIQRARDAAEERSLWAAYHRIASLGVFEFGGDPAYPGSGTKRQRTPAEAADRADAMLKEFRARWPGAFDLTETRRSTAPLPSITMAGSGPSVSTTARGNSTRC
jgi:hypothetical protein